MLAAAFQRCGQRQKLRLGDTLSRQQVCDAGCALGDGAGLVQRHDLGAFTTTWAVLSYRKTT